MNSTQTYDKFTEKGTRIAVMIVNALAVAGIDARIGITYRDYGQNWMWETVLIGSPSDSYQALSPQQFDTMNSGDFDYAQINEIVATARGLAK